MKIGVFVGYRRKYQRILLWFIANSIAALLLTLVTFVIVSRLYMNYTPFLFVAHALTHSATSTVITIYVVSIFGIHDRFNIVNSLLR